MGYLIISVWVAVDGQSPVGFSERFLRKGLCVWILVILKHSYNSFLLSERPAITVIIVVKPIHFDTSLFIQYGLLVYHTKFCPRRYLSSLSQDFSWDEMWCTRCQRECILSISQSETFSSTAVNHKVSVYILYIDVMGRGMKESEWLEWLFVYLTDSFLLWWECCCYVFYIGFKFTLNRDNPA